MSRENHDITTDEWTDPVIEYYMQGVDVSLIRENLKLTADERARKLVAVLKFATECQRANRQAQTENRP